MAECSLGQSLLVSASKVQPQVGPSEPANTPRGGGGGWGAPPRWKDDVRHCKDRRLQRDHANRGSETKLRFNSPDHLRLRRMSLQINDRRGNRGRMAASYLGFLQVRCRSPSSPQATFRRHSVASIPI